MCIELIKNDKITKRKYNIKELKDYIDQIKNDRLLFQNIKK
jgi:hypothetical protein